MKFKTHFHPAIITFVNGFGSATTANPPDNFTNAPDIATISAVIEGAGKSLSKAGPAAVALSATKTYHAGTRSYLVADPERAFRRQPSGLKSIFVNPPSHRL